MRLIDKANDVFIKLVTADDTPHRIALGFAIGIFYGLMPFVGVIFTIVTAMIFKANRASALIGCFVTNTWLSAVLILPSVKIGAKIFGLQWQFIWRDILKYMKMPGIRDVFNSLSGDVLIPSFVGFLIIALGISVASYFISLFFVLKYRKIEKVVPRH